MWEAKIQKFALLGRITSEPVRITSPNLPAQGVALPGAEFQPQPELRRWAASRWALPQIFIFLVYFRGVAVVDKWCVHTRPPYNVGNESLFRRRDLIYAASTRRIIASPPFRAIRLRVAGV